jgi:hypothetical protein
MCHCFVAAAACKKNCERSGVKSEKNIFGNNVLPDLPGFKGGEESFYAL